MGVSLYVRTRVYVCVYVGETGRCCYNLYNASRWVPYVTCGMKGDAAKSDFGVQS